MAAGLPRQDHVWITTNHFVRFHKDEFDEMLGKLDSTEFARSIEQNPILPILTELYRIRISRNLDVSNVVSPPWCQLVQYLGFLRLGAGPILQGEIEAQICKPADFTRGDWSPNLQAIEAQICSILQALSDSVGWNFILLKMKSQNCGLENVTVT